MKIEIDGDKASIVARIPAPFFEGMDDITVGKVLGSAIIKSASGGGGKSEVG